MTISTMLTRFLVEEHKYKPFPNEVHLLGRQTILCSLDAVRHIFEDVGIEPHPVEASSFDTSTRQAGPDGTNPSDTSFFQLFGVESVRAIDHSDFEGADIVFDLTRELPPEHEASADFIFDGSVMDNVFDPSTAMHNVARLLRPGGRYIGTNAASTRWLPAYVAFNPYWFFDFFVANGFRDVKVYVIDFGDGFQRENRANSITEIHLLDAAADHRTVMSFPLSGGPVSMCIIAEKDSDSTWNARTSQAVYRLDDEWAIFNTNLAKVLRSDRPAISLDRQADAHGGPGFLYVGTVNGSGLGNRNPNEDLPVFTGGEIPLGQSFAGYNWGAVETHQGKTWRWIDDTRTSVLLVNLPSRRFHLEAFIHTAKDMDAIRSVLASCDGHLLEKQEVVFVDGEHRLRATIPARAGRREISFSARHATGSPDGRNVALSRVTLYRS